MKKIALIAALLVSTITAASAAPYSAPGSQETYFDRTVDTGDNGGGGN